MTIAYAADLCSDSPGGGGTTISDNTTGRAVAIGEIIYVGVSKSNTGTTITDSSAEITVADSVGNVYTKVGEGRSSDGVAGDGVTAAMFYSVATVAAPIGTTITATFTASSSRRQIMAFVATCGGTLYPSEVPAQVLAEINAGDPTAQGTIFATAAARFGVHYTALVPVGSINSGSPYTNDLTVTGSQLSSYSANATNFMTSSTYGTTADNCVSIWLSHRDSNPNAGLGHALFAVML
jgi:hypothetical protein